MTKERKKGGGGTGIIWFLAQRGSSGFHLFQSAETVVMLLCDPGALGLYLKRLVFFFKTWREIDSSQTATSIGCFHSKKCLICDFFVLEIFFWFPLLIAVSILFLFNDQRRVRNARYPRQVLHLCTYTRPKFIDW